MPAAARAGAWGRATAGFALGQAGFALLLSWLYDLTANHAALFLAGAGALGLALLLDARARAPRAMRGHASD